MAAAIGWYWARLTARIRLVARGVGADGEKEWLSTMGNDFCDFEFSIGAEGARDLPRHVVERNPYTGRAFRSAIEAAYGPLPETMALSEAFAAVRPAILQAAEKKVIAVEGEIDQPVPVAGPDICR